jgi:hypothetical protein
MKFINLKLKKELVIFLFWIIFPLANFAQTEDVEIDARTRNEAIDEILKTIKENYFSVELGEKMDSAIRSHRLKKAYDSITSAKILADTLTQNLYEISRDPHLYIRVSDNRNQSVPPELRREGNFGISKLEILPGNIGYLQINGFPPIELASETLAAAMSFLKNTDALIIDLRNNRGGAFQTVALMVSYFVPEKSIRLIEVDAPRVRQKSTSGTVEKLDAPRYLDKPIYLLTSQNTFSEGEEFVYDMQALKRATSIGETTRGGANLANLFPIQNVFILEVSFAQVKNVITGTNWGGVGVKPDIPASSEKALEIAQTEASKKLTETKKQVTETIWLKKENSQIKLDNPTLIQYPETPAGKTLQEFVQAFNTGEREQLLGFHQTRQPNDEEGKRIANENAGQDLQFYQVSGGLLAKKIVNLSDTKIQLYAQLKNNGDWIILILEVLPEAPFKIVNLGVEQTKPLP